MPIATVRLVAVDFFFGNIVVIVHEKDVGLNPHPSVIRALVSGSEEKTQCGKQKAELRMLRIVAANVESRALYYHQHFAPF